MADSFFALLTPLKIVQGQPYESITQNDSLTYTFNRPPRASLFDFGTIREKTFSDSTYSFRGQSYKKLVGKDTFERELKTIYVREDTSEGKVWALNITDLANENGYDTTEHLVMDLSLSKNDSFKVPYGRISWKLKSPYIQADSVFSINGHKVIYFDIRDASDRILNGSVEMIFIEGVGPTMGFYVDPSQKATFAGTKILKYNALVCAREKEIANYSLLRNTIYSVKSSIFNYPGGWTSPCLEPRTVTTGTNNPTKKWRSVKVFPQPAQEKVTFELNQPLNQSTLMMYTLKGKQVLQKRIQERKFQIEKPNQNRVYFYQILEQGEGLIKSGKILFF